MTHFSETYLTEAQAILGSLAADEIETVARDLAMVRDRGGRLFVIGVGGSAAHASHAVNDFRKCGLPDRLGIPRLRRAASHRRRLHGQQPR